MRGMHMNLQELGSLLKQERERRGLSVRDVMDATKISRRNLNALEDGAVKLLPHPVYLKGYVRNYAGLVGLDAEPLGALVDQQWDGESAYVQQTPTPGASGLPAAPGASAPDASVDGLASSGPLAQPTTPEPEPEQAATVEPQMRFPKPEDLTPRPRKKLWPWIVLIVVVLGVFGLVQQCRRSAPDAPQPLANATEANATGANAVDANTGEGNATDGNASLGTADDSYVSPELNATAPSAALTPAAPVSAPAPPAATTAAPAIQGLEHAAELRTPGMQELVVIAKPGEICWVEVSEGQRRKTFTIRDGDSRRFEFSRSAKVRLGNAGGVSFRLNGSHYPYDGQRGQTASVEIGAR